MSDFFSFYTDVINNGLLIRAFHYTHLICLCAAVLGYGALFWLYERCSQTKKQRFIRVLAICFFVEEAVYALWLLLASGRHFAAEIVPLQLCTICAYTNGIGLLSHNRFLCFFNATIGVFAGLIAMLYPANIDGLYPLFSYRVINFFFLHGAFVFSGLLQARFKRLSREGLYGSTVLIGVFAALALGVNAIWHTDYMFIGTPPRIPLIRMIYDVAGMLYYPLILLAFLWLQIGLWFLYRRLFAAAWDKADAAEGFPINRKENESKHIGI